MNAKPRKRRRFQYSLRTLLLFVFVAAIGLGLLGRWLQQVRTEQIAVQQLLKIGGGVGYDRALEKPIERCLRHLQAWTFVSLHPYTFVTPKSATLGWST